MLTRAPVILTLRAQGEAWYKGGDGKRPKDALNDLHLSFFDFQVASWTPVMLVFSGTSCWGRLPQLGSPVVAEAACLA